MKFSKYVAYKLPPPPTAHHLFQPPRTRYQGASIRQPAKQARMLQWLEIKPSYSRPRVSDDNAYAESLFRTAKYRPEFPVKGFETLEAARAWAMNFVHWYNFEHRHSGIQYVSPAQKHAGEEAGILAKSHELYPRAKTRHPARWSGATRNWTPVGAVTLNPEKESVIKMAKMTHDLTGC